jgi:drug/metabolite transporter (DMT)-like permease
LGRRIAPGQPILLPASALRRAGWIFVLEAYGGSMVFMYGLANSPLVLGSALTSLAPVISVPVALALGLEKPSFLRTFGVATVVAGLWLLTTGGG